jgi:hypothetical protein
MKVLQRLLELQDLELGPKAGTPEGQPAIDALRREIAAPILGHYDRLMVRGKKGVALVRHGVCSGCQMKIASGLYAALLRDDDIAMCDNCARYLLMPKAETPVPPPTPPAPAPAPAPAPTPTSASTPAPAPAPRRVRKRKSAADQGPKPSA